MAKEINRIDTLLASYRHDFLEPLRCEVAGTNAEHLSALLMIIEGPILPVCLAGRGNFHCRAPEGEVTVPVFLQVFPSARGTKMGMLAAGKAEHYLKSYLAHFQHLNLGPVDTVEAWMIHGTDHWFLRPSVWNALAADARVRLEKEFLDEALSVGEPTRERIFDRVRLSAGAPA